MHLIHTVWRLALSTTIAMALYAGPAAALTGAEWAAIKAAIDVYVKTSDFDCRKLAASCEGKINQGGVNKCFEIKRRVREFASNQNDYNTNQIV